MSNKKELIDELNDYQLSRWIALYEAVNLIADNAEKNGKTFDYTHMKKPAIEKYVDSTSGMVYKSITGKELK
jgi:hypothetical protein